MLGPKEKKERALGTRLFLKGERCSSPKCVMVRRPSRPGMHGKKRRQLSDFARQLQEKQKIQISFGLRDRQMQNLFKDLASKKGLSGSQLLSLLERRLDNVVFRLGLAASRIIARQAVSHGHILVNGRKVTVPSYRVRAKDKISVRPASRQKKIFEELSVSLKKYEPPVWLKLDKDNLVGEVMGDPEQEGIGLDPNLVMEYYSR